MPPYFDNYPVLYLTHFSKAVQTKPWESIRRERGPGPTRVPLDLPVESRTWSVKLECTGFSYLHFISLGLENVTDEMF